MRKRFSSLNFKRDDIKFSIQKVSKVKGHAEISVRKGKQILVYEYDIDCDWIAESETDECEGNFSLTEINESDFDFHIPNVGLTKKGEIGEKARQLLKKCLKDEVIKLLGGFSEEIRDLDIKKKNN